ncbi:MAG: toxin-antitoxin system YwqK family antitoxin [Polaribacter sp.]|nr:toxin-antitoxin system YwqK family antitoxin [Polaribacter sp.]MDG1954286.1 toxin-antitoxin system YwqK family antitoxin [Polaribacter sp.]MDG2074620.1 toxin-antitoxin system YwqK family antitoxin [Polaribacter sp.]
MMINIKRLFFVCILFTFFLNGNDAVAQKYNQFDENKKRTGPWKKYYKLNKRIKYVGQFENGKEVGTFKFYNIKYSTHPEAIKVFAKGSDLVKVTYLYDNGKTRVTGTFKGKNRVGKWKYLYKKGTVFSEEVYVDGKLEGKVTIYFKNNGNKAEVSEYKNGVLHGLSKKYSDKEVLIEEVLYENGLANGMAKYYELSGNLKERGIYKNGKRIGKWEFYLDGEMIDEKKQRELRENQIKQKN